VLARVYNRHTAAEIRRRLEALIGEDAHGVTVLTCHGFAMRLVGAGFASRAEPLDDDDFQDVMKQAVEVLGGRGLPPEDADENRSAGRGRGTTTRTSTPSAAPRFLSSGAS